MFESIISELEALGVQFEEDYDAGTLTIPVESIDKIALIEVIRVLNDAMAEFTIDETAIVVSNGALEELPVEEGAPVGDEDYMGAALDEAMPMF